MPDNVVVIGAAPTTSVVVQDTGQTITVPGAATTTVAQPIDQVTNVSTALLGPQGPAGVSVFQTIHTYAIGGVLNTTDFIPPMFFYKLSTQTSILRKIVCQISTGTSATVKLQINGSDATGYTGITVTTTKTATAHDTTLSDGDAIRLLITGISGSPQNLTVTLVVEHNVS